MFQFWPGRPKRRNRQNRLSVESLEQRALPSLTFQFDYSRDLPDPITGDRFFADHPDRQALLEAAGQIVLNNGQYPITDSLAAITPSAGNSWIATFPDPAKAPLPGEQLPPTFSMPNLGVPANTLIVFVGARPLVGSEAGFGGPGGFQIDAISADFAATVRARGQTGALPNPNNQNDTSAETDFGPWGGSLTIDSKTNWYFGQAPITDPSKLDFMSVAEHELMHLMGFGTAPSWQNLVQNQPTATGGLIGVYTGAAAEREFGAGVSVPVPVDAPKIPGALEQPGHWADATTDNGTQATMDPVLPFGTRAFPTELDFAGLKDMGWQVGGLDVIPNQPPEAGDLTINNVPFGTTVSIPVSSLLAQTSPGPIGERDQTVNLLSVGNGQGGTPAIVGDNVIFTPNTGVFGNVLFTYTVQDTGTPAKTATGNVLITIGNPPPPDGGSTGGTTGGSTGGTSGGSTGGTSGDGSGDDTPSTPPVAVAPKTIVVPVNKVIAFTGKNRIQVKVDHVNGKVIVTFTASHGRLVALKKAGLTMTGNNSGKLKLTGPLALINQALAALKFMPVKGFAGAANVSFIATANSHSAHALIKITIKH